MTMLRRCLTYLRQNGIPYVHSIHSRADAALGTAGAKRTPAGAMAKTVVYRAGNDYGMLLLPGDCVADLFEVRRLMDFRDIRPATEPELKTLLSDCETGAIPPFGDLFDIPVLLEEAIASADYIAFAAGTPRDVVHLSVADYCALVNPLVAAFAVAEPAGAVA